MRREWRRQVTSQVRGVRPPHVGNGGVLKSHSRGAARFQGIPAAAPSNRHRTSVRVSIAAWRLRCCRLGLFAGAGTDGEFQQAAELGPVERSAARTVAAGEGLAPWAAQTGFIQGYLPSRLLRFFFSSYMDGVPKDNLLKHF